MHYNLNHSIARHRDIGVMRLCVSGGGVKPVVIVLHGLDSSKERWLTTCYAVARAGFDVVAPDLYLHGDRPEAESRQERLQSDYVGTVGEVIYQTASDLPVLCAELEIDPSKSGILGISAGGLIAHAMAIQETKFKAMVAAITSPNWMKIDPQHTPEPGSPEGMMLASISPSNFPESYPPLALCMLSGEMDTTIYPDGSIEMYDRLKPIYERLGMADHLNAKVYPGAGHYFIDAMAFASVDWFKKFLM